MVSLTKTLDSVNSVVPRASSAFVVERQVLDGCPRFLAGNNMNFTQRTLVASPQPALSSFQLPLAGGVNGHSFSVVPPDGSEQGSPPSESPQVLLYLLLIKIAIAHHCL